MEELSTLIPQLDTDSAEYELLQEAINLAPKKGTMTCEIGTRRGGSSQLIMQELSKVDPACTHISIDPYGEIPYYGIENQRIQADYSNHMRDEAMSNLFMIARKLGINFQFYNMEDTEFFKRFGDGVPTYNHGFRKTIRNQYQMVFLDGPHSSHEMIPEINFFAPRLIQGGTIVIDDVDYCDMSKIDVAMVHAGLRLIKIGKKKAIYQK